MVPVGVYVLLVLGVYALGYYLYGHRVLEVRVVRASAERRTPAWTKYDGVDYVPANKWVLFGHHFASIAGAGPIIGPAMAILYGWLPVLAWIIFGNIFIGAVHDYLSLMASVRHGGASIMSVAEYHMGRRARYVFLVYVYFALLLVVAAFLSAAAAVFTKVPHAATKALIYMPLALALGLLMYRVGLGVWKSTAVALAALVLGVAYAYFVPIYLPNAYHTWMLLLALYSFLAAILPVWYLLQPRDYLNAYILWAFIAFAVGGSLLVAAWGLKQPAVLSWAPPILGVPTPFWPAIVLLVACGSLSGFHSLVASGTTSKQLASEVDALLIGYGGMLTEGMVSAIAVTLPIALVWSDPSVAELLKYMGLGGLASAVASKGVAALPPLARFEYAYGAMLGHALSQLGLAFLPTAKLFVIISAIALATFLLTTLDTATRLARFAWQEMFDWLESRSPAAYKALTNRFVGSAIAVLAALAMAYPTVVIAGKPQPAYKVLWPAFAGTNQLLAALALMVAALWVYRGLRVRGWESWLIQVPAIFLWVTVTVALAWWLVFVAPHLPAIQLIGAGGIAAVSLAIDLYLFYLYGRSMREARAEAAARAAA